MLKFLLKKVFLLHIKQNLKDPHLGGTTGQYLDTEPPSCVTFRQPTVCFADKILPLKFYSQNWATMYFPFFNQRLNQNKL